MNTSLLLSWRSATLALAVAAFSASAQAPAVPVVAGEAASSNGVANAESAATEVQADTEDASQTNQVAGTENSSDTNAPGADGLQKPGRPGSRGDYDGRQAKKRRFDRQSAERGASSAGADAATGPGTNNSPAKLDYNSFRLIVSRNIFNPNRVKNQPGIKTPTPKRTEYVSLVGIMSYQDGDYAFFSGNSSRFEKTAQVDESIADYKVAAINSISNTVRLVSGTNQLEMRLGMSLSREEDGEWSLSRQPATYTAPSSSTSSSDSPASTGGAASADDNDVIKRMMQRREQQ